MKEDDKTKKKFKAASEKVNKAHGETLKKLGGNVNNTFIAEVDAFIEKHRAALKRLAKK